MAHSTIEWTKQTWNPSTGCTKISQGCKFCYAETMAKRLKAMGQKKYENGFKLTLHEDALNIPNTWKSPQIVFVNSMSDLFHEDVPLDFTKKVFKVMKENPQHVFQVLTKRADVLYKYSSDLEWTPNIWMGVSIENEDELWRKDYLRKTGAKIKFLSCEPLLGPLTNLDLTGTDWVIVGGESGPKARPMKAEWVNEICEKCERENVKFFFKQWGGKNKKKAGRMLNGRTYDEMPFISFKKAS